MKLIYLDNNATTQVDQRVIDAMLPYFSEYYGNASSMHRFGGEMRHVIDEARGRVAELLGCEAEEILFTSGGTESDNSALRGVLEQEPHRRHIITTRVEHPAVRTPSRIFQRRGYRLTELAVDSRGRLDLAELEKSLEAGPALVSVMWANNETGVIFPMDKIATLVKAGGGILHCDAVQAVGKIPIDLRKTPIDLLSLSGHKLHGPKGIGVLYIRRGTRMEPFMQGGHQEFGRRAGTENVPAIVGLGKACQLARQSMREENERVRALRDRLEQELVRTCLDARINGDPACRLPNTTNISFEYVEGEAILRMLDQLGIAASSGSACTSGSLEPSHVLRAMGVPFTAVHGSIRFSLSRFNTLDEINDVIEHMPGIIRRLRQISLFSPERDASPAAPYDRQPELRISRSLD
jgi:cysteine desulfurase